MQIEDFFNVTSDSLEVLQRLKCWSNPINLTLLLFCDTNIYCENSSCSSKAHLRANFPTWYCQVWHVLSFFISAYRDRYILFKFDMFSWSTS